MKPNHVPPDGSPGPRRPSPAPPDALDSGLDAEADAVLQIACRLQDRQRGRLSRCSGVTRFRRWGGA